MPRISIVPPGWAGDPAKAPFVDLCRGCAKRLPDGRELPPGLLFEFDEQGFAMAAGSTAHWGDAEDHPPYEDKHEFDYDCDLCNTELGEDD